MIDRLKKTFTKDELLSGNHGIEREVLRVKPDGTLSIKPHPKVFGNKLKNPYITTDFAESQIEVITPAYSDIEEVYHFSNVLYDIIEMENEGEYLWPQSMPCILKDEDIIVAQFDNSEKGIEAGKYREKLVEKYGGKKQLISGIHYNFSFDEEFLKKLHNNSDKKLKFKDFRNKVYLKVTRNFTRYRWLIIYLLGATPVVHESYISECKGYPEKISDNTYSHQGAISYRNGECGYKNLIDLFPRYDSVEGYIQSIRGFVEQGHIGNHKELYNPIRLKPFNPDDFEDSLLKDGINYLEYRCIDINPFEKGGISLNDLYFLQLFNLFLLIKDESDYEKWQEEALENQNNITQYGLNDISLKKDGMDISKTTWALEILEYMKNMNKELNLGKENIIDIMIEKFTNPKRTYAYALTQEIRQEGYVNSHLKRAKNYKEQAYNNRFKLEGYQDLELSTQILIKEAIKRGIKFDVLDRRENFISLNKNNRLEYIQQATKTSKDTYSTILLMENKVVTKKILSKNNIKVPQGIEVSSIDEIKNNIAQLINQPIVIKPKSTNFGIGVSIFKEGANEEDILEGLKTAFKYDSAVLIEEFIKGKEYRFLVINHKVCGILHRVPANVKGDGEKTIAELVEIKNQDPLRGYHYVTPLEKIKLDECAKAFLRQQNKTVHYVPKEGETVYLRENSNISTGGDSIDFTDDIPEKFKKIAIESTKAVNAKFCGVDMMIEDYREEHSNYAIIELNFNPAIHIHSYPYKGKERDIAIEILKTLNMV